MIIGLDAIVTSMKTTKITWFFNQNEKKGMFSSKFRS
jgi:hypothetical protein